MTLLEGYALEPGDLVRHVVSKRIGKVVMVRKSSVDVRFIGKVVMVRKSSVDVRFGKDRDVSCVGFEVIELAPGAA